MSYTVYRHTAPNGKIYIGITSKPPKRRWNGGTGYLTNGYFTKAIKKYGWQNFKHEILLTGLTKEDAEKAEINLIAEHRSTEREFGYNIQHGGNSRGKHSEETKRKIGEANKGRLPWCAGKHHSLETRRKISESHKGMYLTAEAKKKISAANKGRTWSSDAVSARATSCQKKVVCLETGEMFASVKAAAEFAGLKNPTAISACLRGKTKSSGGYHWAYC